MIDGIELRALRLKHRISQQTLSELTGISASRLSRLETGVDMFTAREAEMYRKAVERCASGEVSYRAVNSRQFNPRKTHYLEEKCSRLEAARLRSEFFLTDMSQRELAERAGVSEKTMSYIVRGIPVYRSELAKVQAVVAQVRKASPAQDNAPADTCPAPSEPDNPQVPAKSEHVHYTSCTDKQVQFIKDLLENLNISRERVACHIGMPSTIIDAKLDGFMPMYTPEYEAIIDFVRKPTPSANNLRRQQVINFPR